MYLNFKLLGEIDISQPPQAESNLPPTPAALDKNLSDTDQEKYNNLVRSYEDLVQTLETRYRKIAENFDQYQPIYESGYAGLAAFNATGSTTCTFTNTWLFEFNDN